MCTDFKSPLVIRLDLPIRAAEALGLIRNQAIEPVATAPLSAAMTHSIQDRLPILLLGVCDTAAASKFDLSAGAIVSVVAAFTMVAAAGDASLASAPCALAVRSMSSASFGEATRMASPSNTSSLGSAATCGAPFKVASLLAGLVEARFFAAG